ncbi:hypothetical protein L2E82_02265 [Cichorium intybus]|uniref:Uncharacterized protein n=1 Tax=Cichorium intybus TaxID=13427 RepID=A0ACB9H2B0_CICIN|nr:hypothetical protein L2E82_02265 [Cichorium intybus]
MSQNIYSGSANKDDGIHIDMAARLTVGMSLSVSTQSTNRSKSSYFLLSLRPRTTSFGLIDFIWRLFQLMVVY